MGSVNMENTIVKSRANSLWEQLLCIKQGITPEHAFVAINEQEHFLAETSSVAPLTKWQAMISRYPIATEHCEELPLMDGGAFLYLSHDLEKETYQMYRLYLPVACACLIKPGSPFVMVHVAQSLDGKVCTLNGASKWIGNEENLIHAHRIRALVDGVAVGGNTLRAEQPALTVRHVSGENPIRLIFSNCAKSLLKMPKFPGIQTIVICHDDAEQSIANALAERNDIHLLTYPKQLDSNANTIIRKKLQAFDIHSVMVEGGPGLISWLIKAGLVDVLQVHIAPLLFGSGKSLAEFDSIAEVSQAIHLQSPFYFPMGDAMMMTAELNNQGVTAQLTRNDT